MTDIHVHLPGIASQRIRTARLRTRILISGPEAGPPVLLLHGNLSTATFWEETLRALSEDFRVVAPDLRGYGQCDPARLVDATRGYGDWMDDAVALADCLGWDQFHVVGHSLGGCVGWALIGRYGHRLRSMTLMAPGPPCGFGGARGDAGTLNHPDGAGSGAGLTHPEFLRLLRAGNRAADESLMAPRAVMNRLFWKPPFIPERHEALLTAMLQVHLGSRQYPGDQIGSDHWPGFAPGRFGPNNALSPRYNQWVLQDLLASPRQPPILWVAGEDDAIVSDRSLSDAGWQGKLGIRPGWPGPDVFPPQCLLSQVAHALDQYERRGGRVSRLILPNVGHTPYLERPEVVQEALIEHLTEAESAG
jgi:pimeloyl-ACP methyl ester carboxylesterase